MICSKSMTISFLEFLFRNKHILRFIHKGKYHDILPKFGTGSRLKSPPKKNIKLFWGDRYFRRKAGSAAFFQCQGRCSKWSMYLWHPEREKLLAHIRTNLPE